MIPSSIRRAGPYTGTGALATYPFAFKIFTTADIAVSVTNTAGTVSTLVLDTDYTVFMNPDQTASPGGTITLLAGNLTLNYLLSIIGNMAYSQTTQLPNGGAYNASTVEQMADKLSVQIQQVVESANRALKFNVNYTGSAALPETALRAGRLLAFDALGQPVASSVLDADLPSASANSIAAAASAAAAAASAVASAANAGSNQAYNTTAVEVTLASAATVNIGAQTSNKIVLTGGTTVTSFGTAYTGPILLRVSAGLTIQPGATLFTPLNLPMVMSNGDLAMAWPIAVAGTPVGWQVVSLQRKLPERAFGTNGSGTVAGSLIDFTGYGVNYNYGNDFNPTTGVFTAPEDGVYEFSWMQQLNSGSSGVVQSSVLTLGASTVLEVARGVTSNLTTLTISGYYSLFLSIGNTIKLRGTGGGQTTSIQSFRGRRIRGG